MAELRVFQPGVYQIRAAVDLIEIFRVMGAVPLMRQVMEAVFLGDLVIFVAVPGHEIAHIERVQPGQLFGGGRLGEDEVVLAHAVAQQLLLGESDGNAVLDLVLGGIGLYIGVAAVFKRDVFTVAQERRVKLGRHMQRESIDEPVHIPGGLAVFFKKGAHQGFLRLDVGLTGDDGAAELLADVFQVVLARLRHGEVVLHAEQDGVHAHDFLEHIHLEMAVLAAGDGHGAVISAGAVAAAVFIAHGLKFLPARVPVHILAVGVMVARAAHAVFVERNAGARVGHGAFFTIFHSFSPLQETARKKAAHRKHSYCTPFCARAQGAAAHLRTKEALCRAGGGVPGSSAFPKCVALRAAARAGEAEPPSGRTARAVLAPGHQPTKRAIFSSMARASSLEMCALSI